MLRNPCLAFGTLAPVTTFAWQKVAPGSNASSRLRVANVGKPTSLVAIFRIYMESTFFQTLITLAIGVILGSMKDLFFDRQSKKRALRKALLYLIEVWFDIIRFQRKTLLLEIYIDELGKKFPELLPDTLLSVKTAVGSFIDIADSMFISDEETEDKLFVDNLSKIAEDDPLLAFELEAQVSALDYLTYLHDSYKEIVKKSDWRKINEFLHIITSEDFKENIEGLEKNILLVAGKIGFITKNRTSKLLSSNRSDSKEQIKKNVDKLVETISIAVKQKNGD
ncbi:hypothetical protein LEP1GSC061_1014 [Leptospira wolffii serovar Khorat str. Khorat-H2]|nr:hypothetical protein LEP1GSC061_1014 [Leptospira wolffii serovar Khorat str. Khorat-H2]